MYPEGLDGGQDLLLVAGESHAHPEQVSMETESVRALFPERRLQARGRPYSVSSCATTSRLLRPACRKLCS